MRLTIASSYIFSNKCLEYDFWFNLGIVLSSFVMIVVSLFRYRFFFSLMFNDCCIDVSSVLAPFWHTLSSFSHPFSQLVRSCSTKYVLQGVFFVVASLWHRFGSLLTPLVAPIWFPLAPFGFLSFGFSACHGIAILRFLLRFDRRPGLKNSV